MSEGHYVPKFFEQQHFRDLEDRRQVSFPWLGSPAAGSKKRGAAPHMRTLLLFCVKAAEKSVISRVTPEPHRERERER